MSLWRVLRSAIGSYRSFTMARVRPSKGATSWPRMHASFELFANLTRVHGATEPQRKDRSSCSFFNYRECSCPHGPAMIEISLISFRRLKLENPLQFSLLRSSFPLRLPLTPTSLSSKDSPRRCESRQSAE